MVVAARLDFHSASALVTEIESDGSVFRTCCCEMAILSVRLLDEDPLNLLNGIEPGFSRSRLEVETNSLPRRLLIGQRKRKGQYRM